ncbi:efflux RND transporter periplasmic adaptor subunit [Pseudoalteromonas sp. MMG012]|uniref:efflux RND transporter periplasmic adaptor subunit n=1 Tax=Pseudoalteromonas sp. MMG012 TaxID=2822686 RepID=UPI001B39DDAA|nr:efflux RND transporter periplasmic adaptor subunit [Pseudoalteromonas sp. MMG012]MBQ4849754.1 efflux RND transporter periplasmic adaptor subunit [Pseudoalteromonas sp. MMG012]
MKKPLLVLSILAGLAYLSGCTETHAETKAPATQMFKQPIDIAQVQSYPVQSWFTYTSRLEAVESVSLRPRVSGVVDSVNFREGQKVSAGDSLFTLDQRPFQTKVAELTAQLASANAVLQQAKNESKRAERLSKSNSIAQEELESRRSVLAQRQADVFATQAKLDAAQLDLTFTQVIAPIDGVVSRAEITTGNTVQAGQSELTHIVSDSHLYAYFDINERTWQNAFATLKGDKQTPVLMQLTAQQSFAHQGVIDFVDNRINEQTGTLRVRAIFDAESHLKPGAFARIRLATSDIKEQVLVPEKSIGTDLKNRFVLVTDENDVLQYRLVTLGERYGTLRAIISGLQVGDKIAVNGPARVGPGMPISPKIVEISTKDQLLVLGNTQHVLPALTMQRGE